MRKRTLLFLVALVALLAAAAFFGPDLLADRVRNKTMQAAEEACGPNSRIHVDAVALDLWAGNITWRGVRIEQLLAEGDTTWAAERGMLVSGALDSLHVRGLSLWDLVTSRHVDLHRLSIHGPRLRLVRSGRPADAPLAAVREPAITRISIDTFQLDSGQVELLHTDPHRPKATTRIGLELRHLVYQPARGNDPVQLRASDTRAYLADLHLELPPLYDLRSASVTISAPDSLVRILGLELIPRKEPHAYASVLPLETDVFKLHLDSALFRGLAFDRLFTDTLLRAQVLALGGMRLAVHRDKTLRDEPYAVKPMPPALLRGLPFHLKLDTLRVNDLQVAYFERDHLTPDYGEVSFADIRATVTGLNNLDPVDTTTLRLHAQARVYDRAPVDLTITARILDPKDRFTVHARIGALPFQVFNRMTDDLVLVKATSGRIHGMDYTLHASDDRATGTLAMEYEDLAVSIRKHDGGHKERKFLSFLVNTVKRNHNLRSDANFRTGEIDIERWKDRQIFNYMWRGLKDGIMRTVVPKAIGDVKDLTGKPVEERVQEEKGKARRARQKAQQQK